MRLRSFDLPLILRDAEGGLVVVHFRDAQVRQERFVVERRQPSKA